MNDKPYWENVAFGCLIAVIAAVVLTRNDITLSNGIYIWLFFVVCIGLSFSASFEENSIGKAALLISLTMLVTLCFKGAAEVLIQGGMFYVASIGPVSAQKMIEIQNVEKYAMFYLAIFLLTIPGITIAIFARTVTLTLLKQLFGIKPGKLKTVTKIINYSIKIITIVFGAILAIK